MPTTRYFLFKPTHKLFVDHGGGLRFRGDASYTELPPDQAQAFQKAEETNRAALAGLVNKHQGQDIHIFGTGPSLLEYAAQQDWTGCITIGVNAAPLHVKPLTYWLCCDNIQQPGRSLHTWMENWVLENKEVKTLVRAGSQHPSRDPDFLFHHSRGPASTPTDGLFWLNSSVQAALDLARHMGAARIFLWGVDYHDRTHAYTGSQEIQDDAKDNKQQWEDWKKVVDGFTILRDQCAAQGIEVFNANPNSKLDVFTRISPDAAMPHAATPIDVPPMTVEDAVESRSSTLALTTRPASSLSTLRCFRDDQQLAQLQVMTYALISGNARLLCS